MANIIRPYSSPLPFYIEAPPLVEPLPRLKLNSHHEYKQLLSLGYTTRSMMNELVGYVFQNYQDDTSMRLHDVDEMFYRLCRKHRVYPGCLGYQSYPKSMCINPDGIVAHGLPLWNKMVNGVGILGIDLVTFKHGIFVDTARTLVLEQGRLNSHLCRVTHDAAISAIAACKPGVSIDVIPEIFAKYANENGYSVARGLHSHFILNTLHGELVPNTKKSQHRSKGMLLEEGMVLAIEPIFNVGTDHIVSCQHDVAYRTADGLPSAHFEHTVVILEGSAQIVA